MKKIALLIVSLMFLSIGTVARADIIVDTGPATSETNRNLISFGQWLALNLL